MLKDLPDSRQYASEVSREAVYTETVQSDEECLLRHGLVAAMNSLSRMTRHIVFESGFTRWLEEV